MDDLVKKLRYMGDQYQNGQASRGGGQQKHYLIEAADRITELEARLEIDPRTKIDGIAARDETIRQLEAQLASMKQCMADADAESNRQVHSLQDQLAAMTRERDSAKDMLELAWEALTDCTTDEGPTGAELDRARALLSKMTDPQERWLCKTILHYDQLAAMTAERDHAEITTDAYIDELREQLAATIKERDELRARDQRFSMREPTALRYQLAASQAREKVLRAALKKLHDCFDPDDWAGDESMLGVSGKALTLTIPTDDSALRQYVARELGDIEPVRRTLEALHKDKIGQHWLWSAIERIVAGDAEQDVMLDFGYRRAEELEGVK